MKLLKLFRQHRSTQRTNQATSEMELWRQYRTLLELGDNATKDDAEQLNEIANRLGLDERHVRIHLIAIEEVNRLDAEIARHEQLRREHDEHARQISELNEEIKALRDRREKLARERAAIAQKRQSIRSKQSKRRRFAIVFPQLIDHRPYAANLTKSERLSGPPGAVKALAEELGVEVSPPLPDDAETVAA